MAAARASLLLLLLPLAAQAGSLQATSRLRAAQRRGDGSLAQTNAAELHLNSNKITGDGAAAIAESLKVNPTVTQVRAASFERDYMSRRTKWQQRDSQEGKPPPPPVSGWGSEPVFTRPLVDWLPEWLEKHNATSIVEASAGHWPTGWQGTVHWPALDYVGVDILPKMVEDNTAFVASHPMSLKSTHFKVGDMLQDPLPSADVLLTKDTLIHFPNKEVQRFLELSVNTCPRRFRYVLFVHNIVDPNKRHTVNEDLRAFDGIRHGFRPLDLQKEPFRLPVTTVFTYDSGQKAVQLLEVPPCPQ